MSDKTIRFGYSANLNISFRGEIDTGISREDWEAMSEKEQDQEMDAALYGLVDIYVKDDDE